MNTFYVKMFDVDWDGYDSYGDRNYLYDCVVHTTKTADFTKKIWFDDIEKIVLKKFNKMRKEDGEEPYKMIEVHFEFTDFNKIDVIDLTEGNKNAKNSTDGNTIKK